MRDDESRPRKLLPHYRPGPSEAVDLEIQHHLEERVDRLVAAGMSPDEARQEAERSFGDVGRVERELHTVAKETKLRAAVAGALEAPFQDLRLALRALRRSPGFASVVILTLALGIGANTAIFSVVNGVLLKPLPYQDPDGLVAVTPYFRGAPVETWNGLYALFKEESRTLERFGIGVLAREMPVNDRDPEQMGVAYVSSGLFETLGVQPLMGRWPAEDDGDDIALLSYGRWSGRYGADPGILGQTILANGVERTIVGVMPRGFDVPSGLYSPTLETGLWLAAPEPRYNPEAGPAELYGATGSVTARLRPGVSTVVASQELTSLFWGFLERMPAGINPLTVDNTTLLVRPLERLVVTEDVARTLWILLGTVGFVLLIACANVANLFLVRTEGRGREMAVRTALGASRGRLGRHFLAESTLLASAGGLLGLWLAWVAMRVLLSVEPAGLPRVDEVGIDAAALGVTVGVSLMTALLFGAISAMRTAPSMVSSLGRSGRGSTASRSRFRARNALVVSQVAFALVLLVGAGLMARSFWHLLQVDPGFEPAGVLTFQIMTPEGGAYSISDSRLLHTQLVDRMEALPGVERVGTAGHLVLTGRFGVGDGDVASERTWPDQQAPARSVLNVNVGPGYFEALGIPLLAGRAFETADSEQQSGVFVLSASLAGHLFPGEDPLGERVGVVGFGEPTWRTVVGVVGDVSLFSLEGDADREGPEVLYVPHHVFGGRRVREMTFVVLGAVPPLDLVEGVREVVRSVDPTLAVAHIQTMEAVVADSSAETAFTMILLAIAALVALLMASMGIYAVLAYVVGQRTSEIGVRMALGARASEVSGMVVRQGGKVVLIGLAIGLVGALVLTRVMEAILFDVSPTDPVTYVGVTAFLLAIGLLATYLPARRAAGVDPVEALRAD
ncbi:MAG: ABC transporter permease [Gemmatimonadetes bacterium]|nr:ABC transporter permease [Gemmatimonadota bacterium]